MATTTTLNGGITSSAASFVAANGAAFPVSGFKVVIDTETILVSKRSGNTFTVDTQPASRGYDGTTAASHLNGATITLVDPYGEMAVNRPQSAANVLTPYDRNKPHTYRQKRRVS